MAELQFDFEKMADAFTKTAKERGMFISRWIPVEEELPELGVDGLCQCRANIFEVLALTPDGWYHDEKHCYMMGFVIAWMPLPKPYEENDIKR